MQVKLGKDLATQAGKLTDQATTTVQKLLDNDARFSSDHLKGFDQGGSYAEANMEAARGQLLQADTAIAAARQVVLVPSCAPGSATHFETLASALGIHVTHHRLVCARK